MSKDQLNFPTWPFLFKAVQKAVQKGTDRHFQAKVLKGFIQFPLVNFSPTHCCNIEFRHVRQV